MDTDFTTGLQSRTGHGGSEDGQFDGNVIMKCVERIRDGKVIGYCIWCQGCKRLHFYPTVLDHGSGP